MGFVYYGDMELQSYAPSLFSSTIVVSVSEDSQPISGAAWVKHRELAHAWCRFVFVETASTPLVLFDCFHSVWLMLDPIWRFVMLW